jgi:NAD dependent epimerase/dehydratase
MLWQGKRVLVTGAGGFIGSHLVERLLELGAEVHAFVRYNSRNDVGLLKLLPSEMQRKMKVTSGDLRDAQALEQATRGIEVLFHLGALIAIPYSYLHPLEVIETNVLGTFNVLSAARKNGVSKFVHTSTSEVYGTARYVPISEAHPLQGQSPYSASKIGADKIAESFYRSFDLPVATIRPFNTYGPRQSARAVIPTIITQTLTGDEIRLGSLRPTRDFTFVKDTVEGFLRVAESTRTVGEEMNIGSDHEISIGALAQKIIEIVGRSVRVVEESQRLRPEKSEVQRLWADTQKARELLGWSPQTSLDDGLRQTVAWISQNLERYKPGQYEI